MQTSTNSMLRRAVCILGALGAILVFGAADDCSGEASSKVNENWSNVSIGDSQNKVERELGAPEDKQTLESGGQFDMECWYWGTADKQICFDNSDRVTSKNDY